ncbi:MAG: hypothetical protein PW790_00925 [Parvibaculaceae bacterium]|nr:hypothetical protein [Parvibaculaceae bacterium]
MSGRHDKRGETDAYAENDRFKMAHCVPSMFQHGLFPNSRIIVRSNQTMLWGVNINPSPEGWLPGGMRGDCCLADSQDKEGTIFRCSRLNNERYLCIVNISGLSP